MTFHGAVAVPVVVPTYLLKTTEQNRKENVSTYLPIFVHYFLCNYVSDTSCDGPSLLNYTNVVSNTYILHTYLELHNHDELQERDLFLWKPDVINRGYIG